MELPKKNRTIIIISLLIVVIAIVIMVGWLCNIPAFKNVIPGYIAMRFNAALCFALLGGALLSLQYETRYRSLLFFTLSALATFIGFITIYQDIFHVNIGIDQLFVQDKITSAGIPYPGRMAFNASVNFCLLGLGFLMIGQKNQSVKITAQYIFHLVTILSGIALIGYIYGVELFNTLFYITSMALLTAILFFFLSLAATLLNPSLGIARLFTGGQVGNRMARRLFSLIILTVIILGSLKGQIEDSRLFSSTDMGTSVLAIGFLLISLVLVWNTANWLNKIDARRKEAEDTVKTMNTGLERIIEERSAELREAELKFRTIAEKSMVGVYIVQNDMFTYVNPRFAAVFGYEPEDLLNDPNAGAKIFDASYLETVRENIRRRISGEVESIHYEAMGKKKDGTTNWVEIYGNRVIIGGAPAIIGSMIDISERKKAEDELRSSEQKYKLLFESNPMPMWMISKDDLSVIAANQAAANLYGYTKDELLNMDVTAFRPNEDSEQQLERYKKEASGVGDLGTIRHLKKDGSIIYVQIIAHDIVFEGRRVRLSLTNDITEKLKAEELLQKSEANLQAILNTTDTAYALFDRDLKLLTFNQKTIEFVTAQYDHIPAKDDLLADYFPQDRFPEFNKFAAEVLQGHNINYEVDYPQAGGSVFWYYVRLFPITNDNKEVLGMLMALYDITERKNAEQDLKSAYQRIQTHINNIKDMTWKQSHLIRSPLANLKGLAAMLNSDTHDPEVIEHIQSELHRMDNIIIEMAEDASGHENE